MMREIIHWSPTRFGGRGVRRPTRTPMVARPLNISSDVAPLGEGCQNPPRAGGRGACGFLGSDLALPSGPKGDDFAQPRQSVVRSEGSLWTVRKQPLSLPIRGQPSAEVAGTNGPRYLWGSRNSGDLSELLACSPPIG